MLSVVSPDFQNGRQMLSKPTYNPSSQGCPHGYHFLEIGGHKIGRRSIGNPWFPCYLLFMVILIVREFGNNISIAVWSSKDGNNFYLTFGSQSFIIKNSIVFWSCTLAILNWLGRPGTWQTQGLVSSQPSISASQGRLIDTLEARSPERFCQVVLHGKSPA
jgi:hypothetical protein